MYFSSTIFAVFAVFTLTRGETQIPLDFHNEIVYMSNCDENGVYSSEMDYYQDYAQSRSQQQPDDWVQTAWNSNSDWGNGQRFTGKFDKSGISFSVISLSRDADIGTPTGWGTNYISNFECFKEQNTELYNNGGKRCQRLYSCSHNNHVVWFNTVRRVSPRIATIFHTTGHDAFNNVWFDINGGDGITCSGEEHRFGYDDNKNACSIKFTCDAPDHETLAAMGSHYSDVIGPAIGSREVQFPPVCPPRVCVDQPTRPCCQGTSDVGYGFPLDGHITIYNNDGDDPSHQSQHSQMGYTITCGADCNSEWCNAWVGLLGLIPDAGPFLGLVGAAFCQQCDG